ncbi:hypothetical protein F0562_005153 [Nyssa sinensis]|uniref:AB hydrolase-1 domain-containing protein n=1 Tax=Nyssa sinensis TaxID=561372 RepID=A0A5J5AJI0_9ASTE|nr:hypothetical protein F0562_005153 [Nyssa sinensis]
MGICFSRKSVKKKPSKHISNGQSAVAGSSNRWTRIRSSKKEKFEDSLIHEQALAAAILFQQHQQQLQNGGGGSVLFDRSTSLRYPTANSKKQQVLPRSSSSRARSLTDPLLQPHQLVNQDVKLNDIETNHFVLVHGGGFGAWCWYKTIALLEEGGFRVTAVDLTGSGIHSFDTNSITSLSQYVKPLTDFLEKLADGEKVILVGHDFGGACISGQSTLDMFSQKNEESTYAFSGVASIDFWADHTSLPTIYTSILLLLSHMPIISVRHSVANCFFHIHFPQVINIIWYALRNSPGALMCLT